MKKILLFFCLCLFLGSHSSTLRAQKTFQKIYQHDLSNQAYNILSHSDGGYAYIGIVEIQGASSEVLLTKLDCEGQLQWSRKYGVSSSINNVFTDIVEADNGDLVFAHNTGTFQDYDIKVVRVDAQSGESIWKRRIGGNRDDLAHDLTMTNDGQFVICGTTNSYGTDTNGSLSFRDAYLFKLDADGELLWSQTYGNNGAIENAYAITSLANGELLLTGRFIVDETFYTFLLKTDAQGEPQLFKGYGAANHRTYGYAIMETSDGDYLISGSTTIAKNNFQDMPDVFLLKTDSAGDLTWSTVYTISLGNDNSESGSSIVESPEGDYAIGVPTMSFTTHTSGSVPNKNAVFTVDANQGNIKKALIYNQGASHYTRLKPDQNEGYILSAFSNFYNDVTFNFEPLIIKTDDNFSSNCNEIDVSNEITSEDNLPWDTQDISYTSSNGGNAVPHNPESEFEYLGTFVLCEEQPTVVADFTWEGLECIGDVLDFSDLSSDNVLTWSWEMSLEGEVQAQSDEQNPTFETPIPGDYLVELKVSNNCQEDSLEQIISIQGPELITIDTTVCNGTEFVFNGVLQTESGTFYDTLLTQEGCLSVTETNLTFEGCVCELQFPNAFTPNGDGNNDTFGPATEDCMPTVQNYQISIFSRWGDLVFESRNVDDAWDGMELGEALPSDVYVWFAQYEELGADGEFEQLKAKGDITLIR